MNEHRGRQKGVPNRVTAATREQIASMADPISFLTDVMNGEPISTSPLKEGEAVTFVTPTLDQRLHAAGKLVDKLVPNARERAITFETPPMVTTADLVPALGAVMVAMNRGEITPSEAQAVVIEARRRFIETLDLEQRIKALEDKRASG